MRTTGAECASFYCDALSGRCATPDEIGSSCNGSTCESGNYTGMCPAP